MANRLLVVNRSREDPAEFDVRFARCYRLLYFLAGRILGGTNGAEDAVENCRLTASRNPPRFEYESAFRSWLVRVLIDEALALLREKRKGFQAKLFLRGDFLRDRSQLHGNRAGSWKLPREESTDNVYPAFNEKDRRT
jgi:DNA-directed RNA polymerase specialized sigma24 family protein